MKILGAVLLSAFLGSTCLATDYYLECPAHKKIVPAGSAWVEPDSYSIYVGKDLGFAQKVKSLLSDGCGSVHVGISGFEERCKGCENPFAQKLAALNKGTITERDLLRYLVPLNGGEARKFLIENADQKSVPTTTGKPQKAS